MKDMSWINGFLITLLMSLTTIVAVDIIGYVLKDKINVLLPNYGRPIEEFSRGYPVGHFKRDNTIGFDITPNFKSQTSTNPAEYISYEVWGNSYGCFDDEWSKKDLIGGIYLAERQFYLGIHSI